MRGEVTHADSLRRSGDSPGQGAPGGRPTGGRRRRGPGPARSGSSARYRGRCPDPAPRGQPTR
ncbi:hypothetical protein SLNWT_5272 [Streptomyces albus]|uniref:Uncharacterized protein n=1 Tax=Streptomyces albus (strain ATCC 21838 / DSM 41398 / FERM P-419 / JCM 4703 / NBRC 107858) TaxID=1081613 RepID=A0A0B5ES58_STRA4|nr:hypothetical protein SLNWT_5272 [Streptomyces albus]AOU79950.1 hypothetical protein SLNHY_5259 [Streptomyces albus]AYN35665.1 hypothetical protein DUI70_5171 [Streptomyces albus]